MCACVPGKPRSSPRHHQHTTPKLIRDRCDISAPLALYHNAHWHVKRYFASAPPTHATPIGYIIAHVSSVFAQRQGNCSLFAVTEMREIAQVLSPHKWERGAPQRTSTPSPQRPRKARTRPCRRGHEITPLPRKPALAVRLRKVRLLRQRVARHECRRPGLPVADSGGLPKAPGLRNTAATPNGVIPRCVARPAVGGPPWRHPWRPRHSG